MRAALFCSSLLLLCGCARPFEPIPPQVTPVEAADPHSRACLFPMSDPALASHIVRDIPSDPALGRIRWTGPQPTLHCTLPDDGPWLAVFDFDVHGVTFRQTGPITLTFSVDGREIGKMRCDAPGPRRFRAPLPPELSRAGAELTLQATIDKPFIAEGDGAKLGVLISAAGFIHP